MLPERKFLLPPFFLKILECKAANNNVNSNLTNANHAIFLSPLLTMTDYEYRSCETQAIGRVRRYGQTKKVHVWRFLTENSIDVEIFQDRGGAKFADVEKYVM